MLTFIKAWIKILIVPISYALGIAAMLYTAFKDVRPGIFLLVALIPQPNLWYKYHQYPLGDQFIDILYFAVVVAIFVQNRKWIRTPNASLLFAYMIMGYLSLVNTSLTFNLPFPISTSNTLLVELKNYLQMIGLYFLVSQSLDDEKEKKLCLMVMSAVVFLVAVRAYRNFYGGDTFEYGRRAGGPFEVVKLGANHLGAFMANSVAMLSGLLLCDDSWKRKALYVAAISYGILAMLFSYSRGAYVAVFFVLVYFGIRKKRSLLLVALLLAITWKTILPASVTDRILMTRSEDGVIEDSAAARLGLWSHAFQIFSANPVFGVGYGGFGMTVTGPLTDTHNFFAKTLCEQGGVGTVLLLILLARAYRSGEALLKNAHTPFLKGLGLGFTGCLVSVIVTNMFGDRWSYFVLGGYFWVLWGLVDNAAVNLARTETS